MQGEFVTAEAEYLHIFVFDQILQQPADGDKQQVACAMAEIVIDVLEMIDVQQRDRTLFALGQRRFQRLLQRYAVGQPGKSVVCGEALDFLRRVMLLGDVTCGPAQPYDAALLDRKSVV